MIQYLRRFKPGDNPIVCAEWHDMLTNIARTISVEVATDGVSEIDRVNDNGMDWVIRVGIASAPNSYDAFAISIDDTTATIGEGALIIPHVSPGYFVLQGTNVTLSGASPGYVYATHPKNHSTGLTLSTSLMTSYPVSTASEYRFALWKLVYEDDEWSVSRACFGGCDIPGFGLL
ncbi:MAG: hypothetical protein M0R74_00995 [Dehalococcoidia bacterium]|jgi:hypothetical protein|nr:hypothetical protein [Dehalococcoidia bacterium]